MWTFELAVMFVMIALNSIFAAYEISLASIGVGRLHSLLEEKKREVQREEGIIVSASRLSSTPVKKIALPAEHMDMLIADQTLSDALLAAHQSMHTRYPVTEEVGNAQRIIGYVNFKDIVANLRFAPHASSFRKLIRSLGTIDVDTPISECLERLIRDTQLNGLGINR
jgi:putative hemolysin